MSKPSREDLSRHYNDYIKKVQEMRASNTPESTDTFDDRVKKTRAQGYSAARQGKIYPRGLQNTADDTWEDAKVYDENTREGREYWRRYMKNRGERLANEAKKKNKNSKSNADTLLKNGKR